LPSSYNTLSCPTVSKTSKHYGNEHISLLFFNYLEELEPYNTKNKQRANIKVSPIRYSLFSLHVSRKASQ